MISKEEVSAPKSDIIAKATSPEASDAAARLSHLILIFAIAYTAFIMSPAFLTKPFGPYPLVRTGDALDVFTPLVIVPLWWLLYRIRKGATASPGESVAFLILAALWVEGQAIHLSANSIGHELGSLKTSNAYTLTEFYDEVFSHYLWHIGMVGLSALLILRQWRNPFVGWKGGLAEPSMAGLIYGFTYFVCVVEAQTAPLGVPFAIAVVAFGILRGRTQLRQQPLLAFFFGAHLVALVLFVLWGIYWGGLPEFSKVGIIQ